MRLRVLLSAYYCSPYRGGESAVGWHVATGLAKYHDVTVICGDLAADGPTGGDIERYRHETGLPPGLEIHHVQAEGLARTLHDVHSLPGLWFLYYEAYRRWQLQAVEMAARLHRQTPFDLVHHATVIGFREPGYWSSLGIPFFWGPVSGAPMVPASFLSDFGLKERFRWFTRNLMNRIQISRGGRAASAARAAAHIWAVSGEDREAFRRWGVDAEPMIEGGCTPPRSNEALRPSPSDPLRICWSGLFQGIKALPVLLRAVANAACGDSIILEVLGDGPEASRWQRLSSELGLGGRVRWHGMLERHLALEVMGKCQVLAHTSVKEATSTVVLEALSMGIPIICHDACGMGTAVDHTCGIKISLRNPATSTSGFQSAIESLHGDPALLARLSEGATERAKQLQWDRKIGRIHEAFITTLAK